MEKFYIKFNRVWCVRNHVTVRKANGARVCRRCKESERGYDDIRADDGRAGEGGTVTASDSGWRTIVSICCWVQQMARPSSSTISNFSVFIACYGPHFLEFPLSTLSRVKKSNWLIRFGGLDDDCMCVCVCVGCIIDVALDGTTKRPTYGRRSELVHVATDAAVASANIKQQVISFPSKCIFQGSLPINWY